MSDEIKECEYVSKEKEKMIYLSLHVVVTELVNMFIILVLISGTV